MIMNHTPSDKMLCSSESDFLVNAVMLDDKINQVAHTYPSDHIEIICHSMGCALTRAWLAYAFDTGLDDPGAHHVDTIISMQGAQQGSPLAWIGRNIQQGINPLNNLDDGDDNTRAAIKSAIYQGLSTEILYNTFDNGQLEFDTNSAAMQELASGSEWYKAINQLPLPRLHYYNVYTDLEVHFRLNIGQDRIEVLDLHLGDLVMPPGLDDPHATGTEQLSQGPNLYLPGGERFLGCIDWDARATDCHQWRIQTPSFVVSVPNLAQQPLIDQFVHDVSASPATHLNFGDKSMARLEVQDCHAGNSVPLIWELTRVVTNPNDYCRTGQIDPRIHMQNAVMTRQTALDSSAAIQASDKLRTFRSPTATSGGRH